MTTPTPADLAAALETVRKGDKDFTAVSPQEWYAATELLARWLAENAGRLRVETACEECLGDGCEECNHIGLVYAPAIPAKEGQK